MGGNMALCLLDAGFSVVAYDVVEEAITTITDAGGTQASSPSAVAGEVDVLITSLPNPTVLRDAYLDDDGILAGASEGVIGIDMSTVDPNTSRELSDAATEIGMTMFDAPVEGGPEDCREGSLVILAGADLEAIEGTPAEPVLQALSTTIYEAGGIGNGHTLKLLNNAMSLGNLLLSMEVAALGTKYGVDGETMMNILRNTGGASNAFAKRIPRVLNRNFEPGFSVDYGKKDLRLVLETAHDEDIPMILCGLIYEMYVRASAEGHGGEDVGAVVKLFEQSIGTEVRSEGDIDESFEGYS